MKKIIKTPYQLGNHIVPGLWRFMMPYELEKLKIPEERRAPCSNCPKSNYEGFRDDYRCCTYHPRIPNFLLGFASHEKKASKIINELLKGGKLLPESYQTTPQQWVEFIEDVSEDRFGMSEKVLCPFLDTKENNCSNYNFRNSVCSTFFCLHDHGECGSKFWDNLQATVMQVELCLAQWALVKIGFDVPAYIGRMNSLAKTIKKVSDPTTLGWTKEARKHIWGDRFGHEIDTYRECAKVIEDNLDDLWDIANKMDILEPDKFDAEALNLVPKKYQDEVDDDDFGPGDTAEPRDLWVDTMKSYHRMWQIPNKMLRLSPRALVVKNPKDTAEALCNGAKSHMVGRLTRKGSKKTEWREYIDKDEAKALTLFETPTLFNRKTVVKLKALDSKTPEEFVSEWYGKRILEATK